jgi:hypothetical protein
VGREEEKQFGFSSFYCILFPFHERKSKFGVLHSDINSLKSGLLHLTGQPYCKKSRSAKVKDGIISLFLRNYLFDRHTGVILLKLFTIVISKIRIFSYLSKHIGLKNHFLVTGKNKCIFIKDNSCQNCSWLQYRSSKLYMKISLKGAFSAMTIQ